MRYFIGNLIRGEAAEYYKATCADLSARFGIDDVSSIVPPHITVKSPFDRPSADTIDNMVSLAAEAPAHPITLSGWSSFGRRTIFIDAPKAAPEIKTFIADVLGKLRNLGLPITTQEQTAHLHLSVARFLKPKQFDDVWKYVQSMPVPSFDIMFDNLTIFVKENRDDRAWKVLKTFPLMGKR